MSIGFCLWQTEAAKWLAVNWLVMFQKANWFVFVMSIAFFVMIMTNFIMNVAAIAISLPVALVVAPYLGVAPDVILLRFSRHCRNAFHASDRCCSQCHCL
jgi:sodium-dependent dicarboxylate transporter 2/3/5